MSTNKTTFEDKIMSIAILLSFICFGYWTKSQDIIALLFQYLGFPLPFVIADGLIQIVMICLLSLAIVGLILAHFDKTDEPIRIIVSSDKTLEEAHQDAIDKVKERVRNND